MVTPLTEQDKALLARAANYVTVWVRDPENQPKNVSVKKSIKGCFDCGHSAGPLAVSGKYSTIWIYSAENNGEYATGDLPLCSMVINRSDNFWMMEQHRFQSLVQTPQLSKTSFNNFIYPAENYISTNPYTYTRLFYNPATEIMTHVGRRRDWTALKVQIGYNYCAMAWSSGLRGIYYDPRSNPLHAGFQTNKLRTMDGAMLTKFGMFEPTATSDIGLVQVEPSIPKKTVYPKKGKLTVEAPAGVSTDSWAAVSAFVGNIQVPEVEEWN